MKLVLALIMVVVVATSCATSDTDDGEIVGVVTEVTGDLAGVESFVVLDSKGNSHKFTPADGMTVVGGPFSYLRGHVLSGELVRVIYHEGTDGELIADGVVDG